MLDPQEQAANGAASENDDTHVALCGDPGFSSLFSGMGDEQHADDEQEPELGQESEEEYRDERFEVDLDSDVDKDGMSSPVHAAASELGGGGFALPVRSSDVTTRPASRGDHLHARRKGMGDESHGSAEGREMHAHQVAEDFSISQKVATDQRSGVPMPPSREEGNLEAMHPDSPEQRHGQPRQGGSSVGVKRSKRTRSRPCNTVGDWLKQGDALRRKAHMRGKVLSPEKLQEVWREALQAYQAALAMEPECWQAHYGIGIVYKRMGDLEEAMECFDAALEIEPDGKKGCIWAMCGTTLAALGQMRQAETRLRRAQEIDPHNDKFGRDLASVQSRLDEVAATKARTSTSAAGQGRGAAASAGTSPEPASRTWASGQATGETDRGGAEHDAPCSPQRTHMPVIPNAARNTAKASSAPSTGMGSRRQTHIDKLKEELASIDDQLKSNRIQVDEMDKNRQIAQFYRKFEEVDYAQQQVTMRHSKPWLDRFASTSFGNKTEASALTNKSRNQLGKTTNLSITKDSGEDFTETMDCILPALSGSSGVFRNLEFLDLSGNRMSKASADSLAEFLQRRECHILTLRAENTNMSDGMGAVILGCLPLNTSLRSIQLRHNCLKFQAGLALAQGLEQNSTLRELLLGWNNLHGEGLLAFARSLSRNRTLRRLDLSFNLLGKEPHAMGASPSATAAGVSVAQQAIRELSAAFAMNRSLNFLNLTSCALSPEHCHTLGRGLAQNHSIYGLGIEGNKATTDAKGFVRGDIEANAHSDNGEELFAGQNWDTARWQEHRFEFTVGKSGDVNERRPVYLHLMCDEWRPDEMRCKGKKRARTPFVTETSPTREGITSRMLSTEASEADAPTSTASGPGASERSGAANDEAESGAPRQVKFVLYRMVPPGPVWYFFSQGDRVICARDHPQSRHPRLGVCRNLVDIKPREGKLVAADLTVKPRSQAWADIDDEELSHMANRRPEWDLHRSVYSSRGGKQGFFYDESVTPAALQHDLRLTKLLSMKVVEDEAALNLLSQSLEAVYGPIVALFRWYASREDHGDPFTISWEECRDFGRASGLIDTEFTEGMMNAAFLVTNVELEKEADNDDDTLVRFEFIELLVRVADRKYVKRGVCGNLQKAVSRMHRRILAPYMRINAIESADDFRSQILYTEPVAIVFEEEHERLRRMFGDHASAEYHGEPVMLMGDFFEMMADAGLVSDLFPSARVRKVFLTSILLVENEQTTTKHKEMSYADFLEALARIGHARVGSLGSDALPVIAETVKQVFVELFDELYTEQVYGHLLLKRQGKKKKRDKRRSKMADEQAKERLRERKKRYPPALPGLPHNIEFA